MARRRSIRPPPTISKLGRFTPLKVEEPYHTNHETGAHPEAGHDRETRPFDLVTCLWG